MKLPMQVRVRAPGYGAVITTAEEALAFIDRHLQAEQARLSRWTFARALLAEAQRTEKSKDTNAALRQFRQALQNERWLDDS